MRIKITLAALALLALSTLNPQFSTCLAQGTAFTYQGQLLTTSGPANGTYDLIFTLYDTNQPPGNIIAGPVTNSAVAITNPGLFTATLDFGGVFNGSPCWLEIGVRTNGSLGSYSTLSPRQQITASPYAIMAGNVSGLTIQQNGTSPNVIGGYSGNTANSGVIGAVIAGGGANGAVNVVSADYGSVAGGQNNNIQANGTFSSINGGRSNMLNSSDSTIGGGNNNSIGSGSADSVVGGGSGNYISPNAMGATIGGGVNNQALGDHAAVGGGENNSAKGHDAIGGGRNNVVGADFSGIFGGEGNYIGEATTLWSFIGGGQTNTINDGADHSVIGGGKSNMVVSNSSYAFIGGGLGNAAGGFASTIGGGQANTAGYTLTQTIISNGMGTNITYVITITNYATVCGGFSNTASGMGSFVGGGAGFDVASNLIGGNVASGISSTIGGGVENTASGVASIVGGGVVNSGPGNYSFIGGGDANYVSAPMGTIGGGLYNTVIGSVAVIGGGEDNRNEGSHAVVGGGRANVIWDDGGRCVIGGGEDNTIGFSSYPEADFIYATISGGFSNLVNAAYGTVPGGDQNVADQSCFAAGHRAKANHIGSFVWADSTEADFADSANNQFLIRAQGGVGINTASPQQDLSVNGGTDVDAAAADNGSCNGNWTLLFGGGQVGEGIGSDRTGAHADSYGLNFYTDYGKRLTILQNGNVGIGTTNATQLLVVGNLASPAYCNGFNWVNASDRNSKEDFSPVNPGEVLAKVAALPITEWQYKAALGEEHLGPMAQDFHAAFGLNGGDDTHIATVDEGGVALAAIQGLNQKLNDKEAAIQEQAAEITDLKARLEKLEQTILNQKPN